MLTRTALANPRNAYNNDYNMMLVVAESEAYTILNTLLYPE